MAVDTYPKVIGEVETIAKIKKGFSISRCGDGEFGVMKGGSTSRQNHSDALEKEMKRILIKPSENCIVGIPTMDPKGSKYNHIEPLSGKHMGWHRHKPVYCKFLSPTMTYYSAFISRPDCGEWMMNLDYARLVQSIWLDRKVAVICHADNKILKAVRLTQPATLIKCLLTQAYAEIADYEKQALSCGADLILISGGMMATCLADRLAPKVQAIDIGSIGGFLLSALIKGVVKYEKIPKIKV